MSKEDKHIDNLFQEKLSDRSFDGPPADFLADLNQRLDAKPVVSKGWVWILFLNLFFIGLFIANTTIDFSTTKTAEVEQQIENKELHTAKEKSFNNENVQAKTTSEKTNDAKATNPSETERFSNNSDEPGTNQTESNGVKENQVNTQTKNSKNQADAGVNSKSDLKSQKKNQEDSGNNNSSGSKETSNDSNKNDSTEKNNAGINKGDQTAVNDKTKGEEKSNTEKTNSNKDTTPINGTQSLSSYVSYSAIYALEFEEVDRKITNNDFPAFPNPWNEVIADNNSDTSENPPKQDEDKRMFELQLQGGATQWNYKTLGTNDNYVKELDQSGTPKWTPNFGLGFNVNFNNISIGTGLDYAKFKTENLFEFSEVNTYDSTYIAGYNENVTYDSLGNPIDTTYTPYYDSTTVTDTTYNSTLITNQYEWIQIPIHFGYRFNLNQWAIIPRVGMNFGLGIRQPSGQYPTESYDDLQTLSPVKWNLNLHTSLEIRREFGNWHAFGKFNYQRNLTPTIDNALFERKFNGIGFSFGVGYSF